MSKLYYRKISNRAHHEYKVQFIDDYNVSIKNIIWYCSNVSKRKNYSKFIGDLILKSLAKEVTLFWEITWDNIF